MWKLKEPAPSQKEGGKTDEKEQTIIPLWNLVAHSKPGMIVVVGTNTIMRSTDGAAPHDSNAPLG
jgi:hypothetical protein